LAFVLFFVFADIFGTDASDGISSVKEAIAVIFSIIAIIRLAIALKWQGLGGLLTIAGLFTRGIPQLERWKNN